MRRTNGPDGTGPDIPDRPDGRQPPFRGCPSGGRGGHSGESQALCPPRLLNRRQMAEYLGCSYWSARDWVLAGLVPVVELPPLRPREGERPRLRLRRVLVDRIDLDRFVEERKTRGIFNPARGGSGQ